VVLGEDEELSSVLVLLVLLVLLLDEWVCG